MQMDRRDFLKNTLAAAGSLTALDLAEPAAHALEPTGAETLPQRVLGRTKAKVSLLGFGMAPLGSDNTATAEAERVVHYALDQGINYIDVAPVYGDAESKLKGVLKTRRDSLFLVTKVNTSQQDKEGVQKQIEASLERMGTDRIDLVHIHNLGDFDMEKLFRPDGALAGLKAARKRGLIRFIGTSGHMRPARFVQAIETGDIDVTMNALNFADRHTYDFEGLVLPVAKKHGTAVVAMKVLGGAVEWRYDGKTPATLAHYHERAIRYALGLPGVRCAVIGFATVEEVQQALAVARRFQPLSAAERDELLAEGRKLAQTRGLYYGPVTG